MLLSIETYILRERFGDKKALELLKEAGFEAYDYSFFWTTPKTDMLGDDYLEKAKTLKEFANGLNITCNQAHAPFDFTYEDEFTIENKEFLRLTRSIEAASVLGAKNIIIHAIKKKMPKWVNFYEYNRKFYLALAPYCEKFNINISVENLFTMPKIGKKCNDLLSEPDILINFVRSLNSPYFNICLDLGHCGVTKRLPEDCIKQIPQNLLKAFHIHDNNFERDLHLHPFAGNFNWNEIMKAIKEKGYDGDFTLEIFGFLKKLPDNALPQALKFANKLGNELLKL